MPYNPNGGGTCQGTDGQFGSSWPSILAFTCTSRRPAPTIGDRAAAIRDVILKSEPRAPLLDLRASPQGRSSRARPHTVAEGSLKVDALGTPVARLAVPAGLASGVFTLLRFLRGRLAAPAGGGLIASARGRYDRVVVTSGLSKVYGLVGLRIGWVVAPRSLCEELWGRRDFTTIAPAALSDRLARLALAPGMRVRLRARAQRRVADHYALVRDWIAGTDAGLAHVPPEAGAIVFVGYPHAIGSEELATRLRETASVLVAPGAYFGLDGYLRIGFGEEEAPLRTGLDRLEHVLARLPQPA